MKARFDADGDVLIITGGANGIGAALAGAYAAAGGTVAVFDVRRGADHPSGRVHHYLVDVSDRDRVLAAVAEVRAEHGRIDALVAGAAVQPRVNVLEMDPGQWRRALAVNLDGVLWCVQAVLPQMLSRQSGVILVFGSGLGSAGHPGASAYAASKAALVAFAKSLAAEVATDRIRVNAVFPGVVDTAQFRAANPPGGERERWERSTGIGVAEDVVGPLLFLLSPAAAMTGSVLTRERAFSAGDLS
ncbi:SDR family NAD(P)-dependent oxidoreductase [Plantactinospora sp. GCM10030261]|uniref:SDR family NAD(P)-dependent oxidoreductase n=1 Tax=Plantactinospora sp. GCM10030261 TaxID=3273420 RepID=UPI00361A5899